MASTYLPPGFRFHPTDVELVKYYLKRKVMGKKIRFEAISELNIYKYSPWDLPDKSCLRSKDREWFFFCPKERKYASGARTNRATECGYWKSTGNDRSVFYNEETVGMVKTLVFHTGHAPKGERTDWVMHEYRILDKEFADAGVIQDAYVLCKVFQKSGPGPKNGAQYGAPFNEEDWDGDDDICAESLPSDGLPPPALPYNNSSVVTSTVAPGSTCSGPFSEAGPSRALPSADEASPPVPDNDENIVSLLDMFTEDSSLLPGQNGNKKVEYSEGLACFDGSGIYNGLGDLDNWVELSGGGFNFSSHQTTGYGLNPMLAGDDVAFLELNDLNYPLYFPTEAEGSGHFLTNGLGEPHNYNNNLEQNYCPVDSFAAVEHVSALNQSPLLPEQSNGHVDHFDVFQENAVWGSANLEFIPTYNVNVTPCNVPEEGAIHAVQDQNREICDTSTLISNLCSEGAAGKQQRKSYLRLQHLLESIPARPASAAEHLAPANEAERFKETSLFSANGGSSIHVKAEVTRRGGVCTEDALSQKLGESPFRCCGCNLPRMGFGEKEVKCGSGFAVFFFLGMILALIWVFLIAVFTKVGRYAVCAPLLGYMSIWEVYSRLCTWTKSVITSLFFSIGDVILPQGSCK